MLNSIGISPSVCVLTFPGGPDKHYPHMTDSRFDFPPCCLSDTGCFAVFTRRQQLNLAVSANV